MMDSEHDRQPSQNDLSHWFRSLNIGRKLTISFGLMVTLTVVVVLLGAIGRQSATNRIDLTNDVRAPSALASAQAQIRLLEMVANLRGYLVLGTPQSIEEYEGAKEAFEHHLMEMEQLLNSSTDETNQARLTELQEIYGRWAVLPEQLFALHNNPRQNQPALQIYLEEVRPLRAVIFSNISEIIQIQRDKEASLEQSDLLNSMTNFQSSFDSMMTNLHAYASLGNLTFKSGYTTQLPINTANWETVLRAQDSLTAEQQAKLAEISQARDQIFELPFEIFAAAEGEQAYQDLYLFRTEAEPQAEAMLQLLEAIAQDQQALLESDLNASRQSLTQAQVQTLIGGLLALVLGVWMTLLFREMIAGSVQRLTSTAEQIAGGELDARAGIESGDEIGRLGEMFNHMTGRLQQTIRNLERQTEAAESASRAKSEFLANISHELRTPLNGILGYAQILKGDATLTTEQARSLSIVQDSAEHLLTLINDILDVSKIEAGKLELHPTDFPLDRFLNGIVGMFQIRVKQQQEVLFVYEALTPLPTVIHADEKRLRQILINLLSNAIKFTDSGEVTFRVRAVIEDETTAPVASPAERIATTLTFEVTDTGIGIEDHELERIFWPFEQVGTQAYRAEGTGLGLSITRSLVEQMNGRITVESTIDQGSTFQVQLTFPAAWRLNGLAQSDELITNTAIISFPAETALDSIETADSIIVPPPIEEIHVLYDLAMKGELTRLRDRAAQIEAMGEQFKPFADRLRNLVEAFDEDEILALIEKNVQ